MASKKFTKEQMEALPKFKGKFDSHSNLVQNLKVVSADGNRIKVVGAIPGSIGFSPDGSIVFEYSAAAHATHALSPSPIVNLNHHEDEVIGAIVATEVDIDNHLLIDFEIAPKYAFFVPIIKDNLHDGVSIEATIEDGVFLSDTHVLVTRYVLTGIAVLFTKPPACDKQICKVLSSGKVVSEAVEIHALIEKIEHMDEKSFRESYANLLEEISNRTNSQSGTFATDTKLTIDAAYDTTINYNRTWTTTTVFTGTNTTEDTTVKGD